LPGCGWSQEQKKPYWLRKPKVLALPAHFTVLPAARSTATRTGLTLTGRTRSLMLRRVTNGRAGMGYTTAYCPVGKGASEEDVRAYVETAQVADSVIAEVGAWQNNPVSPEEETLRAGVLGCRERKCIVAPLFVLDFSGGLCIRGVAQGNGRLRTGKEQAGAGFRRSPD